MQKLRVAMMLVLEVVMAVVNGQLTQKVIVYYVYSTVIMCIAQMQEKRSCVMSDVTRF